MTDTNVIKLAQPGTFTDSLTEILRNGAHALLTQAVELDLNLEAPSPHFSPQPRMVSRRVICELIQHVTEPVRYKRTHTKNTLFFRSRSADSW